jgi:hypothetical protein
MRVDQWVLVAFPTWYCHSMTRKTTDNESYSEEEAQRRFETTLRGARMVGHKPQSEMRLGKRRGKREENPAKRTSKSK